MRRVSSTLLCATSSHQVGRGGQFNIVKQTNASQIGGFKISFGFSNSFQVLQRVSRFLNYGFFNYSETERLVHFCGCVKILVLAVILTKSINLNNGDSEAMSWTVMS